MAYLQIKYPEIFTENGSTTLNAAVTNSQTIVLKALPPGLSAANPTAYKIWIGPAGTAASYYIQSVNTATKTITIAVNVTLATTSQIWVGRASTPITAGLSQFYVRLGVVIQKLSLVRFGAGNENFVATNTGTISNNLVQITPSVSATSPSIGTTYVSIGGYLAAATDTLSIAQSVFSNTKPRSAISGTLTFNDATLSYRRVLTPTADNISLPQNVVTRSTLYATAGESLTLSSSTKGSAVFQSVNVTQTYRFSEFTFAQRKINLSPTENISFSDQALLPLINFSTPKTKVVPPILPDSRGASYMLFRHYEIRERHVNVFRLKDGTFVQDYPTPENSNANVPYPYNPNDPSGLYAYVHNWNGTIEEYHLPNPIVQIFLGGETTMVSQELANELVHAGYAAYLEPANA